MQTTYHFQEGTVPLLISMPHSGVHIPSEVKQQLKPVSELLTDTDWHLPSLYNMIDVLGASTIQAKNSRYVIDLNRSTSNDNLYPGQDTTGLLPIDTFAKEALYEPGKLPDQIETQRRIDAYWMPYHQKIQAELQRMKEQFGIAILWEAHSIASEVPRFFEGKLTDLNFGTANQQSCSPLLQDALITALQTSKEAKQFTHIFNGRFKGGYITREYGKPNQQVHAVQLEMSQCLYMNEAHPYSYREDLAEKIQPVLHQLLQTCITWAQENKVKG